MKTFRYNQRITITDTTHPLHTQHGTVRKLQISSRKAWVAMEVELPEARFNPRPASAARRTEELSRLGWPGYVSIHAPHQQRGELKLRAVARAAIAFQSTPRISSEANRKESESR